MAFPQVIALFHALFNVIGLPGNLLVIVTIALEKRFHVMRYILLASLAVSDFLYLILVNSFRIGSVAQERWLYGQTMCDVSPVFMRYFYTNTVLHLVAISYERYSAIVKSPLTYDGRITKCRVALIALIWIAPIPFATGQFYQVGTKSVYNPEAFCCYIEREFPTQSVALSMFFFALLLLGLPLLTIVFLNWSVFKTASNLQENAIQVGGIDGSEPNQQQERARRISERKAAVDVSIIIGAFLLCYLPAWITILCNQFLENVKVPAEAILSTTCIFSVSTLCNPIIYSIRKREFRAGVKKLFSRMGVQCGNLDDTNNNHIGMNSITVRANIGTEESTARPVAPQAAQYQDNQIIAIRANIGTEESTARPVAPQAAQYQDNQIIAVRANIDTEASTARPAAPQAAHDQDLGFHRSTGPAKVALQISRLFPIQENIE